MIPALDRFERMVIPASATAESADPRQPITLAMRLAHRLSCYAGVKRRPLRNTAPLVSFSFDDVPDSAVTTGARILEEFGARGTFFISTGLLGRRTIDWRMAGAEGVRQLAAGGHEIALHTHRHRPLVAMSRRAFAEDLRDCAAAARTLARGASANFAYPFGFGHPAHRRLLNRAVRSSRTTHPGINAGTADLHFLKSWAFGTCLDETAAVDRLMDQTVACGGWLIFTGHDVTERPSAFGCTPRLLAHALRSAAARKLTVAPVDLALDLCGVDRLPLEDGR